MEDQQNPFAAPAPTADRAMARSDDGDGAPDAGRGARLGAALLDGVFTVACGLPAAFIIPFVHAGRGRDAGTAGAVAAIVVCGVMLLALFIVNLVLLAREGQTLGKRIVAVRIVRADRSRAGLGRIFWLRMFIPQLIGAVPLAGHVFRLVDICFIFGDERRCLHDLIADTRVVEATPRADRAGRARRPSRVAA